MKCFFSKFGIGVTSLSHLNSLKNNFEKSNIDKNQANSISQGIEAINFYLNQGLILTNSEITQALQLVKDSKSQLNQDLFVQVALGWKISGFFVEFGATDGIEGSNTKCLEDDFAWEGILAEPAEVWYPDLYRNRKAKIAKYCIWKKSGEILDFIEADVTSTLAIIDGGTAALSKKKVHKVETITLEDLLNIYDAPHEIDYLSIDTEGSEYEILENFDFNKYKIKVISIEHNFGKTRKLLFDLLTKNGFVRVFPNLSQFDDWYVSDSLGLLKFERFNQI
jgi:FkbM family methyltransferase